MQPNSIIASLGARLGDAVLHATAVLTPKVLPLRQTALANRRPHERIIRIREVVHRVGVHRGTIYKWIKGGRFPHQVVLGANSAGWYETDIDAWIADPSGWRPAA